MTLEVLCSRRASQPCARAFASYLRILAEARVARSNIARVSSHILSSTNQLWHAKLINSRVERREAPKYIVYLIVRANAKPLRAGARENLAAPAGIVASRVAHRSDCDQFSGAGDGALKQEQHGDRASITSKSADALRAKKCARAPPRPREAPRDAREAAIAASLAPAQFWCGRLEADKFVAKSLTRNSGPTLGLF